MQGFVWEDFSALAVWMSEEIAGDYYMEKRYYYPQKQPIQQPPLPYRVPIFLCHEERTVLALFIEHLFRSYWETGKTNNFNWNKILLDIVYRLGMGGYEKNRSLKAICWAFTKGFPDFIKSVKRRYLECGSTI
jgi:hypothetical protein